MLTCRRFHQLLQPSNNPRLYRHIFYRKFNGAALAHCFPHSTVNDASRFFPELRTCFRALHCIRSGDIHHPDLQDALLTAYIMVLEHDSLNYQHLLDVSLPVLLDRYINKRLHRSHNIWPVEDTCNTLAIALFWHMTSQGPWMIVPRLLPFGESSPLPPSDALNGESIDSCERMMDTILLPLAFAWFRVHPFLSSSPHPLFQPIVSLHPCSTHLQSKDSTLIRSSTEAPRHHRIHITKFLPHP